MENAFTKHNENKISYILMLFPVKYIETAVFHFWAIFKTENYQ